MLVDFSQMKNCYLVCGYTDLRKGIDGLASVITSQFQLDLLDESVFLFCGRRVEKLTSKQIEWLFDGFYIYQKQKI
ncbi:IS66 family insertion sequence element accessory protein TnpB [Virgibacillus dokdonensis]|uniref:IS66 family insertion sequence element accessory protein TnpB n=1 Tax=Virgibacillus dokdonensis TaxID=302167 RepID=UPI00098B8AF1|nr:IS66 family insertion sequence element accessory protein TnpB [Virgibacillus dokdonensis]